MATETESVLNVDSSVDLNFVDGLQVKAFGVTHNVEFYENNRENIENLIGSNDFLSLESDYSELYKDEGDFYSLLFKSAWKHQKAIVCSDPSSEAPYYPVVDQFIRVSSVATILAAGPGVVERALHKQMTRREFLKGVGLFVVGFLSMSTKYHELLEYLLVGDRGTSPHPVPTDTFSEIEFRNSAFLAGLNQLATTGRFSEQKAVHFVGRWHIDDYRGYLSNDEVDMEKVSYVYKHNLYSLISKSWNYQPTIRIWQPTREFNTFELAERIPITLP